MGAFCGIKQQWTGLFSSVLGGWAVLGCPVHFKCLKKVSAPLLAADNVAEPSPFQRAKHNYERTYSANMHTDEIALFLILRNHTPLCTLHGRDSTIVQYLYKYYMEIELSGF
jgi:hypothetical protein